MKHWWVRLVVKDKGYGTWVPTGCADWVAACDYTRFYLTNVLKTDDARAVREWLLM